MHPDRDSRDRAAPARSAPRTDHRRVVGAQHARRHVYVRGESLKAAAQLAVGRHTAADGEPVEPGQLERLLCAQRSGARRSPPGRRPPDRRRAVAALALKARAPCKAARSSSPRRRSQGCGRRRAWRPARRASATRRPGTRTPPHPPRRPDARARDRPDSQAQASSRPCRRPRRRRRRACDRGVEAVVLAHVHQQRVASARDQAEERRIEDRETAVGHQEVGGNVSL